jgi:hypothetical protein
MNKSGDVANYKHHAFAETKDVSETNTNMEHKKGEHVEQHGGKVSHSGNGMHLKNIPHGGSDHHKGNLPGFPVPAADTDANAHRQGEQGPKSKG